MIDVINALIRETSIYLPCCDRYTSYLISPASIGTVGVNVHCPFCKSILNVNVESEQHICCTIVERHLCVTIHINAKTEKPDCANCGYQLANFFPKGVCDAAYVECQKCHTWNELTVKLYLKNGDEMTLTTPDQYFVKYEVKGREP